VRLVDEGGLGHDELGRGRDDLAVGSYMTIRLVLGKSSFAAEGGWGKRVPSLLRR
jgi:hypothetical protein